MKFQVLLARHKAEEAFYAVKVLQKKAILKKKEVRNALDGLELEIDIHQMVLPLNFGTKLKFATKS